MKHYGDADGLKLLSHNAIFNIVLSNRNYGKTWAFKRRAVRRAFKHNKKTLWLRMFKKEAKEAIPKFFKSHDLQKYCGISLYDKDGNPKGNVKQIGKNFYYKRGRKWEWFLGVYSLQDVDALRSVDDVNLDTIVFDEFTKTPEKYKRYRGNIVNDYIDIFFSMKREHEIKNIFLGNKESVNNPLFTYFNIKPLPTKYEGIRTFKEGSIAVQQINNKQKQSNEYDKKLGALLSGTAYGRYINDAYKNDIGLKTRKTPSTASIYCQVYFNHVGVKISVVNGFFYCNGNIERGRRIYCDVLPHKFKNELLLVKRQRRYFIAFIEALADNRVYYDSQLIFEALTPFKQWLAI